MDQNSIAAGPPVSDPSQQFQQLAEQFAAAQQRSNNEAMAALQRENNELKERIRTLEAAQVVTTRLQHGLRVLRTLGSGGFGQVYLCERNERGTMVKYAVKEVLIVEGDEWLLREVQTLVQLRHKNTATCLGHWTVPIHNAHNLYIHMEYCGPNSLRSALKEPMFANSAAVDLLKICHIFKECLEGLAFIHKHGILHRDICPLNIVLTEDYTPKFVDFGTAVDSRTLSKSLTPGWGKALYMAPEMIHSDYTEKTDVFSLGVVFYEVMLHLGRPQSANEKEHDDAIGRSIEDFKKTFNFFTNPWITIRSPLIMEDLQQLITQMVSEQAARPRAAELLTAHPYLK